VQPRVERGATRGSIFVYVARPGRGGGTDEITRSDMRTGTTSAPPGQVEDSEPASTGCAPPAKTRAALHPWLHPAAPLGPKAANHDVRPAATPPQRGDGV
jgi:hypothetical protein